MVEGLQTVLLLASGNKEYVMGEIRQHYQYFDELLFSKNT